MGRIHLIQIFLNLQLPTKLPVQPQKQKSAVRGGYELMSLDLTLQGRGAAGVLTPPSHHSSSLLGEKPSLGA